MRASRAPRVDADGEVVVGRDHLEAHLRSEQARQRVLGEAEVVVRVAVQRERLVRLDKEQSADLERLHQLVRGQRRVLQVLEGRARQDHVEALTADHVREPVQVGDYVHVRPGLDVRAEELGGVRHPVAVHGRAPRLRLQRAELEHARRRKLGTARDEALLEVGAGLALGSRPAGEDKATPESLEGGGERGGSRGRHRGPIKGQRHDADHVRSGHGHRKCRYA